MANDDISSELVAALDALKRDLAHAREHFREKGDGGREGALEALRALVRFVDRFGDDEITDLLQPVLTLGLALSQFGNCVRIPNMFAAPPRMGGRPTDHHEWNALKALAAKAVTILTDAHEPEPESRGHVARALTNAGYTQPNGDPITAETVRAWRQDAMQGAVTKQGSVAAIYREYQTLPAPPEGVPAQAHADQIIAPTNRSHILHAAASCAMASAVRACTLEGSSVRSCWTSVRISWRT
jgi:hypothetical protein